MIVQSKRSKKLKSLPVFTAVSHILSGRSMNVNCTQRQSSFKIHGKHAYQIKHATVFQYSGATEAVLV